MTIADRYARAAEVLGAEIPMGAFSNEADVVRAASLAGGVGVFGATRYWPEEIAAVCTDLDATLGGRPYCINLATPKGMPEHDDRDEMAARIPEAHRQFIESLRDKYEVPRAQPTRKFPRTRPMTERQLQVVLDSDAPLVALALGTDAEMVERVHATGKKVISLVGTPRHARKVVDAGADIVVAQGYDSAAHTGRIGTFSLIPAVVAEIGDAVPVLAAGGITSGAHMAAALALGASGFWTGTTWLLTTENHTHPSLERKLLQAGVEDTVILRADSGKPQRNVRSAWSDEWEAPGAPEPLKMPYQHILIDEFIDAVNEHDVEPLVHYPAGQGIGLISDTVPVADRLSALMSEMTAVMTELTGASGSVRGS